MAADYKDNMKLRKNNKRGVLGMETATQFVLMILIVAIVAFATIVVLSSLNNSSAATTTTSNNPTIDETLTNVNYTNNATLARTQGTNSPTCSVTAVRNATDNVIIGASNFTLFNNATECFVVYVPSAGGGIGNNSNWVVNYTSTRQEQLTEPINQNVSSGIVILMSNSTTWFALLAVVVIILIIAVVIFTVNRFGTREGNL